jgi:hypothetical protein
MTTPLPAPFYATPRTPTPARALFSLGGNTHRPFIARCVHEALVARRVWRCWCRAADHNRCYATDVVLAAQQMVWCGGDAAGGDVGDGGWCGRGDVMVGGVVGVM